MTALVIGVGNPDRGDDGVGAEVVARLSAPHAGGLRTCLATDPVDVIEAWAGEDDVVVVDAVEGEGLAPGTVVVLAADDPAVRRLAPAGTHAVGLATVLDLARTLDRLPPRLALVGVVGAGFAAGAGLSPAVEAAVPFACRAVRDLVEHRRDATAPP